MAFAGGLVVAAVLAFYFHKTRDPLAPIAYAVARAHGWDSGQLRVTTRSDLSTSRHQIYRISRHRSTALDLAVVAVKGHVVFDSQTAGAFERLMREEDAIKRLPQLGGARIANWFATFGDGTCGTPEGHVDVERRPGNGVLLRYTFSRASAVHDECTLELDSHGKVVSVASKPGAGHVTAG